MAEELKQCPFCEGKVREPIRVCDGYKIVCHCGLTYVGMVSAPEDLIRCWNRRAQQSSQGGEAVAWRRRDGVMGCKRFMTQKCYDAQSPQMKGNYEPFYCAHCKADQVEPDSRVVPVDLLELICKSEVEIRDNPMAMFNAVERLRALLEQSQ